MNLGPMFFPDAAGAEPRGAGLSAGHAEAEALLENAKSAALAATMQQLIEDLPEQIALLDDDCTILVANSAWRKTAEGHGYFSALPGGNYRTFCEDKASEGYRPAAETVAALDEMMSGKRSYWQLVYNGEERWSGRDFQVCIHRMAGAASRLISVTRFDLTEILELRREKEDLHSSLTERQATERQRLARELHDSTSQSLAAIGLLLANLKHRSRSPEVLGIVDEIRDLLGEAQEEIRLISYLGHPPALEKLGLAEAIKSLVEGFGRRTKLGVSFEIRGTGVPITPANERAIYRIAQEALSNVQRHARATRTRILLCFGRSATHLLVVDDGIGITREEISGLKRPGVGLAGMRERMAEIGGRLSVQRLDPGTAIIASIRDGIPEHLSELLLQRAS